MLDSGSLLLHDRIARRIHELRSSRGLSLEALATMSGVSRSMISLIERGESSPTAVVLEKLSAALDVTLAALFEPDPPGPSSSAPDPMARRQDQPVWKDPGSGYLRRNVSPGAGTLPVQIVEVHFPAGSRVAFESGARESRVHQQVWVLEGSIEITVGEDRHRLREGDCLAMELDRPTMFHNATRRFARYAVVMAPGPRVRQVA